MKARLLHTFTQARLGSMPCPHFISPSLTLSPATVNRKWITSRCVHTASPQQGFTKTKRPLIALGIETSCDDTCAAVVTSDRQILSEVLRTQHHLHEPMGGIVPKLAHHAHMRNLPEVVREAIQRAGLGSDLSKIDVVAVTRGPGLAHCLGVGLNAAKTLAAALDKPLIGVHHMEAHALTARLTSTDPDLFPGSSSSSSCSSPTNEQIHAEGAVNYAPIGSDPFPSFPFLALLVSGGHTLLLVVHSVDRYTTLATTVDDSVGEAFDKTARELDIPWLPGRAGGPGASLEAFAKEAKSPMRYFNLLPIPMSLRNNKREMKFSFAGLKSAVTRVVNEEKKKSEHGVMDTDKKRDLAAGFQARAVTHLCRKVEQGLRDCQEKGIEISSLVISGGVGRNATLRHMMEEVCANYEIDLEQKKAEAGSSFTQVVKKRRMKVICPPPKLCTDNAVMIAWTGLERYQQGLIDRYDIDIVPKWPLDMLGTGVLPE
ncbi:hypothetical protein BG004_006631 [Podila humilis]|nr:hypothetical protein BG004_006631 [Podila humilis]